MNQELTAEQMQPNLVVIQTDQLRQMLSDVVTIALMEQAKQTVPQPDALEPETLPKLATRYQTADYLGVSVSTVDQYVKDKLLTKKKVGLRAVRFDRDEVLKLARAI